jgi:hypothetical protein
VSEQNDKWSYIWGNVTYTVSKTYDHLMGGGMNMCIQHLNGFGDPSVK